MTAEYPGLEINEEFHVQQRVWTVQHVGWLAMCAIGIAALIGLLGPGPLSNTTVAMSGGAVQAEYERFLRYQTSHLIKLKFNQATDHMTAWISSELLEAAKVENVFPEPESVSVVDGGVLYQFKAVQSSGNAQAPAITLELTPLRAGMQKGRIGATAESAVEIWQFVYP